MTIAQSISALCDGITTVDEVKARLVDAGCVMRCLTRFRSSSCPLAQYFRRTTGENVCVTSTFVRTIPALVDVELPELLKQFAAIEFPVPEPVEKKS